MNNYEHINTWRKLEKARLYDQHVNPIDWNDCYKVDETFPYVETSKFKRFTNFIKRTFIVTPYAWYINTFERKTKVVGKKNLKGLKGGAVITCNHVYMFDCFAVRKALRHKLKYVVAEFNNRKGFLGDMMRAEGIMPLSNSYNTLKNFNYAVEKHLNDGYYVVFYPEQALWYQYDKPRPYKNGAFHYAQKHNVPVVPLFITYRRSRKKDESGVPILYFTINIGKPIYPTKQGSNGVLELKEKCFDFAKNTYETFYKKPCPDINEYNS